MKSFRSSIPGLRKIVAMTLMVAMLALISLGNGVTEADPGEVLILDTTVSGGLGSVEAAKVTMAGRTPVLVNAATWGAMTTADFADYDAIVLGDATCGGSAAAAEANVATWAPAITGNVVIVGTDPVFHNGQGGNQVTESGIAFAVDQAGETGAYITLSCYYHGAAPGTPVPLLSGLGAFTVTGVGCYNDAHIVLGHSALGSLDDTDLSDWSCSVHEAFDSFPGDFLPLVIAEDPAGGPPFPGSLSFPDGTSGVPYIMARGEGLEICGDGEDNDGDGEIDEGCPPPPNTGPDCDNASADPALLWPPNHKMVDISILVSDPDSDEVAVTVTSIFQDEPVDEGGSGKKDTPDGVITDGKAEVKAERTGDYHDAEEEGRVYVIGFIASDGIEECSGEVLVGVPHDQGQRNIPIQGPDLYDSTVLP